MCYHPITIINPSKYVSLKYRHRYLLQVPCGHCAECATNKANEWYFRSYQQILDCFSLPPGSVSSPFVLFDTLTYRNEDLPHISDFVSVPNGCDYPCFNSRHIQLFNKRLRKCLIKYGSKYSFFVTSEYGTSEKHTHRPHYHILIYSDGNIEPLQLSALIAKCWSYGRTDGLPYKSAYYVRSNVFTSDKFAESLRTCRYVSKYIQKSCKFEAEIVRRMAHIMLSIADNLFPFVDKNDWLNSVHSKRVQSCLYRHINQFHFQSIEFGAGYMRNVDITDFDSINELSMPDSKKVQLKIPLPQYYKRKFYYDVKKIDGNDTWIPNELGMQYLQYRDKKLVSDLENRLIAANHQANTNFDVKKLADYVLNYRGRINAVNLPSNPMDVYYNVSFYNYSTLSDREHLEKLGLTRLYAGNTTLGYRYSKLFGRLPFKDFIDKYVILNPLYEQQLEILYNSYSRVNDKRQKAFELRQHLTNLYHHLGIIGRAA